MKFEKQFELRYFEMNSHGEASPTTVLTLLEEAAADHCLSIGYGLYDLMEKYNIGWILLSGYMEMVRYPRYKEKITIQTWLSLYRLIRGTRENIIYGEDGKIIGRAKGQWLFYNVKKKKAVKVFDEIRERWSCIPEESVNYDIYRGLEGIDSARHTEIFKVKRYDTDSNEHVNNIRYLQWLLETIPEDTLRDYFLHSIEGHFVGEAHYNDTLKSLTEPIEPKENTESLSYIHTVRDMKTNTVYATAQTNWKIRV